RGPQAHVPRPAADLVAQNPTHCPVLAVLQVQSGALAVVSPKLIAVPEIESQTHMLCGQRLRSDTGLWLIVDLVVVDLFYILVIVLHRTPFHPRFYLQARCR